MAAATQTEKSKNEIGRSGGKTAAATTTTTTKKKKQDELSKLEEHVQRAELTVAKNKAASDTLNDQWRGLMFLISIVLIGSTLHQAQLHMTGCVKDIKLYNDNVERTAELSDTTIPGFPDAMKIVLKDSFEYVVAFVSKLPFSLAVLYWNMCLGFVGLSFITLHSLSQLCPCAFAI